MRLLRVAALLSVVNAIALDITSTSSIKSAAEVAAKGLLSYYNGNQPGGTPGLLPQPYYWWEAGAMLGGLIDYWYLTGDTQFQNLTTQGLLWQVGPNRDYLPPNQTLTEGNDDQGFWGIAVMQATERNYPNPPPGQPQWLALTQAVFNSMALRWDTQFCGGGLRWQIYPFNNGWNYKNTISNGCLFHLAARLARYTDNSTYADWANKAYDWTMAIGLGDESNNYAYYDGSDLTQNCTQINHIQWSYNAGSFLIGSAYMYNYTNGGAIWKQRIDGILNGINVFFAAPSNIMYEAACEPSNRCNLDQRSFKAYLSRFMTYAAQMAPYISDTVYEHLKISAPAAAQSCTGGTDGTTCGLSWLTNGWDGSYGVGEQMSAMETIQSLLPFMQHYDPPVTQNNGGNSTGNAAAGTGATTNPIAPATGPTTTADKAGAAIITIIIGSLSVAGCYWLII